VESIVQQGTCNDRCGGFLREVEIEVTRYDDRHIRTILVRVLENLCKLTAAEFVIAAAFEMDIVGNHVIPKASNMAHESYSGTEPPLKLGNRWNVPARVPKTRLPTEPKNARFSDR
jgi:hypothetical protein